MLKLLRNKKTAKKIWIILAILIVPAFVLWGSGSLIRSKQEVGSLGKIFGKKISLLEYRDALEAVRNEAIIRFGDKFEEVQKYLNLESQAWERLILLAEAKKHKIKVSNREVIEFIESYHFFQRKDRFDNAIYLQMLQYVFHTPPRVFEEQTRQNLILYKLYRGITDSVTLMDEEIKEGYRKTNEQISIYYLASLYADFMKDTQPFEEELKDYFNSNSLQFKEPPSFNIEYISLDSENKINEITSRINKKEDFIKAAKDLGVNVKESGLFNQTSPIPGIGWSPEILNLISKAKAGEFLPPINLDKSYYIIRLKERKEPYIPDLETIKDKVKEALVKDRAQNRAREKIEECLKKIKEIYQKNPKSVDFTKAAKDYGLKSDSTQAFKYGSYIEGVGASDKFWIAVQNLKEGEFSEIIEEPSGFYIIKQKTKIPVDEKKFESEKDEFAAKLLLQKKEEYFSRFVQELKRKIQSF